MMMIRNFLTRPSTKAITRKTTTTTTGRFIRSPLIKTINKQYRSNLSTTTTKASTSTIDLIRAEDSPNKTPWYLREDEKDQGIINEQRSQTEGEREDLEPTRVILPERAPIELKRLNEFLFDSPFFERSSIRFIDLKLESRRGGIENESWTDWVVIVNLRNDRLNSIRAATESIRFFVSSFKSIKDPIRVEGFNSNRSYSTKNIKNDSTGPDHLGSNVWSLIDCGNFIVNVMTESSRELYDLESVWLK